MIDYSFMLLFSFFFSVAYVEINDFHLHCSPNQIRTAVDNDVQGNLTRVHRRRLKRNDNDQHHHRETTISTWRRRSNDNIRLEKRRRRQRRESPCICRCLTLHDNDCLSRDSPLIGIDQCRLCLSLRAATSSLLQSNYLLMSCHVPSVFLFKIINRLFCVFLNDDDDEEDCT